MNVQAIWYIVYRLSLVACCVFASCIGANPALQ